MTTIRVILIILTLCALTVRAADEIDSGEFDLSCNAEGDCLINGETLISLVRAVKFWRAVAQEGKCV